MLSSPCGSPLACMPFSLSCWRSVVALLLRVCGSSRGGHEAICTALLEAYSPVVVKNHFGLTAEETAKRRGFKACALLIKAYELAPKKPGDPSATSSATSSAPRKQKEAIKGAFDYSKWNALEKEPRSLAPTRKDGQAGRQRVASRPLNVSPLVHQTCAPMSCLSVCRPPSSCRICVGAVGSSLYFGAHDERADDEIALVPLTDDVIPAALLRLRCRWCGVRQRFGLGVVCPTWPSRPPPHRPIGSLWSRATGISSTSTTSRRRSMR